MATVPKIKASVQTIPALDAAFDTAPPPRRRGLIQSVSNFLMQGLDMSGFRPASPYVATDPKTRMPDAVTAGPEALGAHMEKAGRFSRHFYRNDGALKHGFNLIAHAVVGTGPTPNPKHKELKPLWNELARRSDPSGALPLPLQVFAAYLDELIGADVFGIFRPRDFSDGLTVPLQVQFLPSEFVPYHKTQTSAEGSHIICGVQFDPNSRDTPTHYWMYPFHPYSVLGTNGSNTPIPIRADRVMHLHRTIGNLGAPAASPGPSRPWPCSISSQATWTRRWSASA